MPEAFVPFEIAFAPQVPAADFATGDGAGEESEKIAPPPSPRDDALADARRFRAALAEALDAALTELLRDVSCEVLGRELQLAPADVSAIACDALKRYDADVPLRLRAHPDDAPRLEALELPIILDAALRRGDVTIELRSGTIDASLGARLEALLARE